MKTNKKIITTFAWMFFLVLPASTNYQLKDYGFGTGGTDKSSSSNYSLEAITGELGGSQAASAGYKVGPGMIFTGQANVPAAPTFDNPGNYYNKLRIILNPSNNASDTKFAIAISTDDFMTTGYVQNDSTVGAVLGLEDYRTYAGWGGAGGTYIIGLVADTAYKVKAKAMHGSFSETDYGPSATAATDSQALSFDLDVSATDSETNAPYAIDLGSVNYGVVIDSSDKGWVDFATNGELGGNVTVRGLNAGLLSPTAAYLVSSLSGDLDSATEGFGLQGSSVAQDSGGPFIMDALYDQAGNIIGIADATDREIFSSASPVAGGRGAFLLKVKTSADTPSGGDYGETLTLTATVNF
ncbi:MAG: hypothetical protein Q8L10_02370 [Candidatus Moranbacteria bacterium]|nr:hypothetical protein [Candidatus Moranbacteria bacterium]